LYNSPSFGHALNATTPLSALLTGRRNVVNQPLPPAFDTGMTDDTDGHHLCCGAASDLRGKTHAYVWPM
jgi:hypothetical protein